MTLRFLLVLHTFSTRTLAFHSKINQMRPRGRTIGLRTPTVAGLRPSPPAGIRSATSPRMVWPPLPMGWPKRSCRQTTRNSEGAFRRFQAACCEYFVAGRGAAQHTFAKPCVLCATHVGEAPCADSNVLWGNHCGLRSQAPTGSRQPALRTCVWSFRWARTFG